MLKKIYDKDQGWFAVLFIVVYVVGGSVSDNLSKSFGIQKSITILFFAALIFVLYNFIKQNKLKEEYGLCKVVYPIPKWSFYLPLIVLASINLCFGVKLNMTILESILYVVSMFFVGFLEEVIFRGLLFKSISKNNITIAIVVSSITFGLGHIVNLFNGSGADLYSNIFQIVYATIIGFLFVTIFLLSKSLWPCIITHGAFNAVSTFLNRPVASNYELQIGITLIVISLGYSLFLWKIASKSQNKIT